MDPEEVGWHERQLRLAIERQAAGADPDADYLHGIVHGIESRLATLRSALHFHEQTFNNKPHSNSAFVFTGAPDPRPQLRRALASFEALLMRGREALAKAAGVSFDFANPPKSS